MIKTIQTFAEKAAFFFVVLFGVLLPFDMLYATIAFYPILFFTALSFRREKLQQIPKNWWVFTLIILLNLAGFFYTSDTVRAGFLLERQLLIFVFPILLPLISIIDKKKISIIFSCFTFSCISALTFLFYKSYFYLQINHLPFSALKMPIFYNHLFTNPIGIHATYLSLYVSLCIIFLLHNIRKFSWVQKPFVVILLLILFFGMYFMASRNTILALFFIILIIYPLYSLKHKLRYFFISALCIVSFLYIGNKTKYMMDRFSSGLIEDIKPNVHHKFENPEPRIMRWQCALELIKKRPVFGYGSGDEIPRLKELYLKKKMKVSYSEEFNTHNQFLSILLKNGIFGLIIFFAMMVYFFSLAIKAGDFIYLSFLILLSIGFITENIIDANKGIFFFAFFNTLLGYRIILEKRVKEQKPVISLI